LRLGVVKNAADADDGAVIAMKRIPRTKVALTTRLLHTADLEVHSARREPETDGSTASRGYRSVRLGRCSRRRAAARVSLGTRAPDGSPEEHREAAQRAEHTTHNENMSVGTWVIGSAPRRGCEPSGARH
jgi:hypothetical protein